MRKCKIPQGRIILSSYERIAEKLLKGIPKPKPFGILFEGKFLPGNKSTHLSQQARRWRLFWHLKYNRNARIHREHNIKIT
jgi:hypothetical protein